MLKIGITGIGFMGMMHYLAYEKIEGVKVVAICEKIPERLKGDWTKIKGNFGPQGTMMDLSGVETYDDLGDMLKNPELDVVDVCLPPFAHRDAVVRSLEAGKNVICEKPITLTTAAADDMVGAANTSGKMLLIGHVLPFYASHGFICEAVQSGRYGKLLGGNFNRVISDPTWLTNFYDMDVCGGPMLDLHIHDAHFIRMLFGMPKAVRSVGRCRGSVPEYFNTQFLFEDSELVVTAVSGVIRQQGRPFTHGYEVHFERATVLCESFTETPVTVLTEDGKVEKPQLPVIDDIQTFVNELSEATHAIKTGTPSPILDGRLARDALAICYGEIDSIHRGKCIDLR